VLGHEIAHAVARHSAEQYSTQVKQQYGVQGASILASVLGAGNNAIALGQTAASYGLGLQNLHYSRSNESEADHLGLIFAAMAGYNPQVAVGFWQRMSAASSNKTSEFLSSHPSDETRIKQIQGWMPEALSYYQAGTNSGNLTQKGSTTTKNKPMKTIHIK